MSIKELWKKVNDEYARFLMYLYERWQDEKEYEDIAEYLECIKKKIPEAYKITKRPFGIKCKCEDGELYIKILAKGRYLQFQGEITKNVN